MGCPDVRSAYLLKNYQIYTFDLLCLSPAKLSCHPSKLAFKNLQSDFLHVFSVRYRLSNSKTLLLEVVSIFALGVTFYTLPTTPCLTTVENQNLRLWIGFLHIFLDDYSGRRWKGQTINKLWPSLGEINLFRYHTVKTKYLRWPKFQKPWKNDQDYKSFFSTARQIKSNDKAENWVSDYVSNIKNNLLIGTIL